MDVFKLLSKSAKPSQSSALQNLPSSGEVRNPQLFGHSEDLIQTVNSTSKRKRKRGQDVVTEQSIVPVEIDFFGDAPRVENKKSRQASESAIDGQSQTNGLLNKADAEELEVTPDTVLAFNEDERKRILRSHKLRVTLLEDFTAQQKTARSVEKQSKKQKEEILESLPKKAKTQIYPSPLTSFSQLRSRYDVFRKLVENLDAQGYIFPTEVQLGGLPLLLGNHFECSLRQYNGHAGIGNGLEASPDQEVDLLTIAPTGSGKTIAFLVPVINALIHDARSDDKDVEGSRAIVLAPTKELAGQIVNEARKLAVGTGIKAALMKKGMEVIERPNDVTVEEQDDDSESSEFEEDDVSNDLLARKDKDSTKRRRAEIVKAAILVATPLALLNALKCPDRIIADLPSARYLVLDEADVLLDPLFRQQTLSLWNACTNPRLRVSLWSATMGSNIEELAISTINSRWQSLSQIPSQTPQRAPLLRLVVGLKDTAIPNVSHKLVYSATEQGKLLALRQLLHPTAAPSTDTSPTLRPPFLIFTQTIPRAIALHAELLYDIPPEAGGSSRIAVLHADLPSTARDSVMARFRRGEVWVLITTDLLARGVDFRGLNGVVNYDVPNSAAAYVHRVGRTGRAGRQGGVAVTLYTQEDIPYIKNVANVIRASEKLLGKGENEGEVKQWLLDALPTPSKRDRQRLKKRGVEARRPGKVEGTEKAKTRISTKSGWERKVENKRRGKGVGIRVARKMDGGERGRMESDFEGFED